MPSHGGYEQEHEYGEVGEAIEKINRGCWRLMSAGYAIIVVTRGYRFPLLFYVLLRIGGLKMDKKCYVIMPFSTTTDQHSEKYWTIFYGIIKNIMERNGYSCTKSEVGPYKLFSEIVKDIESSDVVIAVLTDFNSNVWYELGIRHTLKTGTVMLLQEGQKVPFDVSDFGIIFYEDSIGLEQHLKPPIEKYLRKLNDGGCDSPVISVLNSKAYCNVEKKLEEMESLLWRLIREMPKDKNTLEPAKIKRNRILWVDDYPINNKSVMDLLSDKGINFVTALTTEEGLNLYKSDEYDLIITDMGRGHERDAGLSLLKGLRLLHCPIPIVVYTTRSAIDRYGAEATRLGAYKVTHGIGNIISIISNVLEL